MAIKKIEGTKRSDHLVITDLSIINIVPGFNARGDVEKNAREKIMPTARLRGIDHPIDVRRNKDADNPCALDIVDGESRFLAAMLLREEGLDINLPATLIQCSDEEAHLRMVSANLDRTDWTPVEESFIVMRFVGWGWDDEKIAEKLGKSETWVQTRKKLSEAGPDLKDAIVGKDRDKPIPVDVAADIAANFSEDKQMEALAEIESEANQEAEATTKKTGKKAKPNLRKSTAKKTGTKIPRPGIKDVKRVATTLTDRLTDRLDKAYFTGNDIVNALTFTNGVLTEKALLKGLETALSTRFKGKLPSWWVTSEAAPKKKKKKGKKSSKKKTPTTTSSEDGESSTSTSSAPKRPGKPPKKKKKGKKKKNSKKTSAKGDNGSPTKPPVKKKKVKAGKRSTTKTPRVNA
jgi:hypothetical protein